MIFSVARSAADEIAPITVDQLVQDKETGEISKRTVTVTHDEGLRATTAEGLAGLRTVLQPGDPWANPTITAGNASQLSDGAAAAVVMEAGEASRRGLQPLGFYRGMAVTGVKPEEMGIGPVTAIPKLLANHGLTVADIGLWEIHEAFASQVLANVAAITDPEWVRTKAGVQAAMGDFNWDRVNPNGGSVAIGHPFGATGARDLSQAVKELWAMPPGSRAIVSICADGGQGTVALLERPWMGDQ